MNDEAQPSRGTVVLRQPGAVIVRQYVPGRGVLARRVELGAGVQPQLGSEIQYERQAGVFILTGGG